MGLKELQKEVEKNIKQVFALAADEISQPVMARAHFVRSQLSNWRGKAEESKKDFDKAVELDSKNAVFPYRRGVGMLKLGKSKDARELLKAAVDLAPNNILIREKLLGAQIEGRDFGGAEATLAAAMKLNAERVELLLLKGKLLNKQKRYDEAQKTYEEIALNKFGGKSFTLAQIGIGAALRDSGDSRRAVAKLEKLLTEVPSGAGPDLQAQLFCEMGLAHEAGKKKLEAQEAYRSGIQIHQYYGPCHYYLARNLGFRGAEAKSACKSYLTVEPVGIWANECRRKMRLP